MSDPLKQQQSHLTFKYEPLNTAKNEIRVVKLQVQNKDLKAHSEDADIVCTIEHVSLDETPHYVALSYVWGDSSKTYPVTLNNTSVQVTENMYQALIELQQGSKTTTEPYALWIDALCIDQSNSTEKGTQIQLMQRIYSQASQVLIWLGLPDPETTRALHQLRDLGQVFQKLREKEDFAYRIQPFVEFLLKDGSLGFHKIWKLIRQRPWWSRLWVIQEAILAEDAIIVCGNHSANWKDLSEGLRVFEWMILCCGSDIQYRTEFGIIGDFYPTVIHFLTASSLYKSGNREGLSLLDLLLWTAISGNIQATDPRDRIYGLLGLLTETERKRIPVDYSVENTCEEVLVTTTKVLIAEHGPNILSYCQQSPLRHSSTPLPTWVPDWTSKIRPPFSGVSPNPAHQKYTASGTRVPWKPKPTESIISNAEEPVLSLEAIKIGRIIDTASEFTANPNSETYISDCRAWLLEIEGLLSNTRSGIRSENEHERNEIQKNLWRIPIVDTGVSGQFSRPRLEDEEELIRAYEILTGVISPPLSSETLDDCSDGGGNNDDGSEKQSLEKSQWVRDQTWNYRRLWNAYFRRPFVCEDGRVGLGPVGLRVGDLVCIFVGGDTPFVVRGIEDLDLEGIGERSSCYELLGDAYVYGLMDGEAIIGSPVVETFRLR